MPQFPRWSQGWAQGRGRQFWISWGRYWRSQLRLFLLNRSRRHSHFFMRSSLVLQYSHLVSSRLIFLNHRLMGLRMIEAAGMLMRSKSLPSAAWQNSSRLQIARLSSIRNFRPYLWQPGSIRFSSLMSSCSYCRLVGQQVSLQVAMPCGLSRQRRVTLLSTKPLVWMRWPSLAQPLFLYLYLPSSVSWQQQMGRWWARSVWRYLQNSSLRAVFQRVLASLPVGAIFLRKQPALLSSFSRRLRLTRRMSSWRPSLRISSTSTLAISVTVMVPSLAIICSTFDSMYWLCSSALCFCTEAVGSLRTERYFCYRVCFLQCLQPYSTSVSSISISWARARFQRLLRAKDVLEKNYKAAFHFSGVQFSRGGWLVSLGCSYSELVSYGYEKASS